MTDRPDDLTQPISTDATSEQPPVDAAPPAVDAAQPAVMPRAPEPAPRRRARLDERGHGG